jgi:4-hydroxybenzoate polyprenyltransferase
MLSVSAALGVALPASAAALGFAGTLVVYGVDRLRDLERDRTTSPARTAFVERHRRALLGLCVIAAIAAGVAGLRLPPVVWAVCAAAGVPGLLHRRLKQLPAGKTAYVSFAWLVVCVGIPVAVSRATATAALLPASVIGLTLVGNVIASNWRDDEGMLTSSRAAITAAAASCAGGTAIALAAGSRVLAPIPLLELAAIAGLAAGPADRERYGLIVVDGALWAGALAGLAVR